MADNVELNAGSGGALVATDDDGTAQVQWIKLKYGPDGTFTAVAADQGLPVKPDSNGFDVTNGGTFAVQVDAALPSGSNTIGVVDLGAVDNAVLDAIAASVAGTLVVDATGQGDVPITLAGESVAVTNAGLTELASAINVSAQMDVNIAAQAAAITVDATGQGDVPITLGGEAVVLGAGSAAIGKLAANSGVDIGDVDVTSISAGSNLIGDVGVSVRTSGGTSIFRSIDLDETEEEIKATAGQVYWLHCMNLTASVVYLKLYNATAANVTVGTTTPVLTFPIPTQGDTNGAGFTLSIPNGIAFSTAITAAVTTGIADNDTTGPTANGAVLNLGYA